MSLEDRIAALRLMLTTKISQLDIMIEKGQNDEEWYKRSLRGQRADYKYFVKEIDGMMLDYQMEG